MSVTFGAIGTGANGSTSCTPSYPTGIAAATSKLYCIVGSGASGEPTPTMVAGWTRIFTFSGGSGATFGDSVGNRRVTIFKKDTVTGSESGTETVSLASGNTMRAHIVRVEVGSGNGISEQWASGQDTTNGTGWSAAASSNLAWIVGQLILEITIQCQDTATVSSKSLTATGVTFGTLTNQQDTAVTTGNDLRFILDTASVNTAPATASAPTYAHTNSVAASGPSGFLLLNEEISNSTGRLLLRGQTTYTANPNIGSGRTALEDYSMMGLNRGTPVRRRGHFHYGPGTTALTGQFSTRGSNTTTKLMSSDQTGRFIPRGATTYTNATGGPTGSTDLIGRFSTRGSSTFTKTGSTSANGFSPFRGSITYTSTKVTAESGRWILFGSNTYSRPRNVGPYSRMSLLRGTPMRRAGSFVRRIQSDNIAQFTPRGSTTAVKLGRTDVIGRFLPRGQNVSGRLGRTDLIGRVAWRGAQTNTKIGFTSLGGSEFFKGQDTTSKIGIGTMFGFQGFRSLMTYTAIHQGRSIGTYSALSLYLIPKRPDTSFHRTFGFYLYGNIFYRGASTAIKTGSSDMRGLLNLRGSVNAGKRMAYDQHGVLSLLGANTTTHIGSGDEIGRLLLFGRNNSFRLNNPTYDLSGRWALFGATTASKTELETGLVEGLLSLRGANTTTKLGRSDQVGLFLLRGSNVFQIGPQTDLRGQLVFFGSTTGASVPGLNLRGRIFFFGSTTGSKFQGSTDITGRVEFLGSTTNEKFASSDEVGTLLLRGKNTVQHLGQSVNLPTPPVGGGGFGARSQLSQSELRPVDRQIRRG